MFPFHRKFKFPSVNGLYFPMHSYILVKSILYALRLSLFIGEEQERHRIIKNVILLRLNSFKIVSNSFFPASLNRVCASLLSVSWVDSANFLNNRGLDYLKCKCKIRSDDKPLQPQSSPLLCMELWKGQQVPAQGSDPGTGPWIAVYQLVPQTVEVWHIFLLFECQNLELQELKNMVGKIGHVNCS